MGHMSRRPTSGGRRISGCTSTDSTAPIAYRPNLGNIATFLNYFLTNSKYKTKKRLNGLLRWAYSEAELAHVDLKVKLVLVSLPGVRQVSILAVCV